MLDVPVAFLIFNRPDLTALVFAEIARARPRTLYVIADGPRDESDGEDCAAARQVIEGVDWDCRVVTNYSDRNLGCKQRVSSGLTWLFEQCEAAIILEDDCLPHPSFFPYCAELLERYRDDERVMMISGDQFQPALVNPDYSYCFSQYSLIWGWATWRRAWRLYDVDMALFPVVRALPGFRSRIQPPRARRFWLRVFENQYLQKVDTWDYQWQFACWVQGGFTILPAVNLISNIGFRDDATHTKGTDPKTKNTMSALPTSEMPLPLIHPPFVLRQPEIDAATCHLFREADRNGRTFLKRFLRRAASLLRPRNAPER